MSIKQITKLRYKTKDKPPIEEVPLLGYNKKNIAVRGKQCIGEGISTTPA